MREPPAPYEFLRALEPALRQAAAIAQALEGRVANRPKAGEATPAKAALTIADTATQEALLVPLAERFSRVCLEAEEDTPSVARFSGEIPEAQVVIDPIDGTLRFYLQRRGAYAVMVGLAIRGRFEASLVALPRDGLFFEAARGLGARTARGAEGFRPVTPSSQGRCVLVSDGTPEPVRERLRERGYEVRFGAGGAIAVAPLIPGVRAGLRLAPQDGSISRRGRIGLLIAREAGALIRTETGTCFPEAIDAPAQALLVAAGPAELESLRLALAALP